ncbi:MAG: methyltransferase domain-containing protein [Bacteroidota bacterium]
MNIASVIEKIKQMNYPDFVAYIGQINTPPGEMLPVYEWIKMAVIQKGSYLLDLACSTRFSSRKISKITQCKAQGIDISQSAIERARQAAGAAHQSDRLTYLVGDATDLAFAAATFTHIVAGCNFGFIQQREKALEECKRVLKSDGRLCVANFYYDKTPPESLLNQVQAVIGFKPNPLWTLLWWQQFFSASFKLIAQSHHNLSVHSENVVRDKVYSAIYEESEPLKQQPEAIKKACFDRLLQTRHILNQHRNYQKFEISI